MDDEDNINKLFGQVLKKNRKKAGYSQEKFALKSDVHRTYISSVERGLKSPTLEIVNKLVAALDLTFGDFYRQVDSLNNFKKIDLTNTRFDKDTSQQIIDNLNIHILVLTLDSKISKYNRSISTFFNLKDEECKDYSNYFSSENNYRQHLKSIATVVNCKKEITLFNTIIKEGITCYFETNISPIYKNGSLDSISEVRNNITEKVYLEKLNNNKKIITEKMKRPGKKRILIMDDSYIIREILMGNLSDIGFNLSAASDGEEAIKKYKNSEFENNKFDLVIFDLMIIDGMGGLETLKELKKINPQLKSIGISGYNNFSKKDLNDSNFDCFLPKPLDIDKLKQKIYDLLDV